MDSSAKFAALVEKVEKTKRICLAHNDVAQNYVDQISDLLAMSIHQPRPPALLRWRLTLPGNQAG
jgi:hypothetical protein